MDKLKNIVERFLEDTGMTRTKLASEVGCSRVSLWKKLNGVTEFTFSQAIKLAEIVGCSLDDFRSI